MEAGIAPSERDCATGWVPGINSWHTKAFFYSPQRSVEHRDLPVACRGGTGAYIQGAKAAGA
jgi:hypothetical protein